MNNGSKALADTGFGLPGVEDDFDTAVHFGSDVGHALAVTARGIISLTFGDRRGEQVWNSDAPQDRLAVQAAYGRAAINLARAGKLAARTPAKPGVLVFEEVGPMAERGTS